MMTLLVGQPGAGKTLTALKEHIIPAAIGKPGLHRGRLNRPGTPPRFVITNIPIELEAVADAFPGAEQMIVRISRDMGDDYGGRPVPFDDATLLKELSDEFRNDAGIGPLFVLDEVHLIYSKSKKNEEVRNFYTLHRHHGVDVVFLTQNAGQVDRDLVALCESYTVLIRNRMIGLPGNTFRRKVTAGYRGAVTRETKVEYHDKKYFPLYRSHFSGEVKESEPKAKPIWTRWPIIAAAVAIPAALIFAISTGYPAFMKMMGQKPVVPVEQPATFVSAPKDSAPTITNPLTAPEIPVVSETASSFASSANDIRQGLTDLGALSAGAAPSKPMEWSIRSVISGMDPDGNPWCKIQFRYGGQSISMFDLKRKQGWSKIETRYELQSDECFLTIHPISGPTIETSSREW